MNNIMSREYREILGYIRLFRKWLWLIALSAILVGGAAFLLKNNQTPTYQARVLISVGGYIASPNPNTSEINTAGDLAQTYAVLVTTRDVLSGTLEAGDFPLTLSQLRKNN